MHVVARLNGSAHVRKTPRVRAALFGLLDELPFICPAVAAIGSLIMS